MSKVIIVTGVANSIGRSTCKELARAGHTVYVSMREMEAYDEHGVEEAGAEPGKLGAELRTIAFDLSSEASVNSAIDTIVAENNRLDVIVHNARQVLYGPAEAFTPDQLAELYDTNVLSAQRLNRAALPQLRKQGHGLLIWVSSSSARGGSVPFLGAYASSKAALDALALGYAGELARWGVETTIVVPSALGPGHYVRSGRPLDTVRAEEYADGPTADLSEVALSALAQLPAKDRTPQDVANAIADVVDMPFGQRPLRVHFGPDHDGAAAVDAVADSVRAELLRGIGLEDILKPAIIR
ncbi:SDR family NAD(P)-dependent oxidoreductase [Bradyrhizobium frederickii]|uniref:SDR family NAD(P)-dependent oxidoreductase n=1 Tax=Bradyrhizobium frederickii TaxID=2560054 RepID=A0A4Y9LIE3_9BRAD|nr:SDR family NAD(P)-dependent oxidoreductase [Bradyrhizobium frederickii]TFV41492.1 SDR family NAD(P)-dependent oxidoreductase [Bradyrhizobium frederickii]